jgi:Integrase core domain
MVPSTTGVELSGWLQSLYHPIGELKEQMIEPEVQIILERAKKKYPEARPRIISDNTPLFIAKNSKEFIRISGMTHVRTAPYCPQSNYRLERFYKTIKAECIRPGVPLFLDYARRIVEKYIEYYNSVRLHKCYWLDAPNKQAEWQRPEDKTTLEWFSAMVNLKDLQRDTRRSEWFNPSS